MSTSTWLKIAGATFVTGSTAIFVFQKRLQSRVRALPHYTEAFQILAKHERLLSAIGEPIHVGEVDLSDRQNNFVSETESRVRNFENIYIRRLSRVYAFFSYGYQYLVHLMAAISMFMRHVRTKKTHLKQSKSNGM